MCNSSIPNITDEEIFELVDGKPSPERRRELVRKLVNDPEAAEVLALAYSGLDTSNIEGLPEDIIDNLLKFVQAARELDGNNLHP